MGPLTPHLSERTWPEVEAYLSERSGIFLPTGSTEQHGPVGLIGTDTLCATLIADRAAGLTGALVAPPLAYTPAPFNTAFPGTLSLSTGLFEAMATEILQGLVAQGFRRIFVLNGHGANLAPLAAAAGQLPDGTVCLRSWWDFPSVGELRKHHYGAWEGMHATPSEIAITRAVGRTVEHPAAEVPPVALSPDYIAAHSGDRHGPPAEHRAAFPDGRVGSHSALGRPEHGRALLAAAAQAAADAFTAFESR
ncbi:MAG: creatininase family protein [Pseudomonadota bacterium]